MASLGQPEENSVCKKAYPSCSQGLTPLVSQPSIVFIDSPVAASAAASKLAANLTFQHPYGPPVTKIKKGTIQR